jgi:hypothetical protein
MGHLAAAYDRWRELVEPDRHPPKRDAMHAIYPRGESRKEDGHLSQYPASPTAPIIEATTSDGQPLTASETGFWSQASETSTARRSLPYAAYRRRQSPANRYGTGHGAASNPYYWSRAGGGRFGENVRAG